LSSSVVSRKDVANADQTNVPQAGLREPASSDTARPSVERQEISSDANLAKPAKPLLPMTGKALTIDICFTLEDTSYEKSG
jgi:hypothetical protein